MHHSCGSNPITSTSATEQLEEETCQLDLLAVGSRRQRRFEFEPLCRAMERSILTLIANSQKAFWLGRDPSGFLLGRSVCTASWQRSRRIRTGLLPRSSTHLNQRCCISAEGNTPRQHITGRSETDVLRTEFLQHGSEEARDAHQGVAEEVLEDGGHRDDVSGREPSPDHLQGG